MKQPTKQLLSLALCALLLLSLLPVGLLGREAMASPEGLYSLSLVGSGFPGLDEWDPADPAGCMTEVSESVYEKIMTFPEDTTISFKVVGNGQWDDRWNFGSADIVPGQVSEMECGGGSADMVLSIAGGSKAKFIVNMNDLSSGGKATILVEVQGSVNGFKTVYAKADWSQCYVYCWNADGSTLGSQWPGSQMSLNEDGLWEGTVSENAFNVLFNDGIGNQTPDLVMPDSNESVYLHASNRWVSYEEATGVTNWGIESLSIVGSGLPGLGQWDYSDGLMNEIADNVYVKSFEVPEATTLTFLFVGNSESENRWVFGGASAALGQTVSLKRGVNAANMDLTLHDPCTLRFIVDLNPMFKGGDPTVLVENALSSDTERKVTVIAPVTWDDVYAYTWDPEAFGSWPGKEMEKTEGGYQLTISDTLANLVFSTDLQNSEWQTTSDIRLEPSGGDAVVTIYEDMSVDIEYEHPVERWDLESLALAGEGLPGIELWNPADPAGDMYQLADYAYEKTLTCTAGTDMEFKVVGNDQWDDKWSFGGDGTAVEPEKLYTLTQGSVAQNLKLSVSEDCTLRLVVDLSELRYGGNATLWVEKVQTYDPTPSRKLTVVVPDEWVRVHAYTWNPDTFGGWPGAELPKNGNTCETMISQDLVNLVISGELENGTRQQTTDILLESNGKDVTVLVNAVTCEYTVVYGENAPAVYRVVGDADWMGSWDPASDAGLMTQIEPRKFQKCFKNVRPGTYEYKITKNGTWDGAYGDAGDNCVLNVGQVCDVTFTLTISIYGELDSLDVDCAAILAGDMNGDGRLNMGDVAKLYAHIRGSQTLGQEALSNADFTGDGKINMGDAASLYAHIRSNI